MSNDSNGNGNGSSTTSSTTAAATAAPVNTLADGIREKLKKHLNAQGQVELSDHVQIQILSLFLLQKMGKASMIQVQEKAAENHAIINENELDQCLEGLRARGLLSYSRGRKKEGDSVQMYRIRQAIWAAPPEVAHIMDLLPALLANEDSQNLIDLLNDAEEEGDGEKKSKRRLGYDEYVDIRVDFQLKTPIIGSTPVGSPHVKEMVRGAKHESQLPFWRSDKEHIIIPSDSVRGWLRTGMRTRGGADAVAGYMGIDDVYIPIASITLGQVGLPVIDPRTKQGKGISTYEIISAGAKFSIHFRIPTRGFMTPDEFVMWLAIYSPRPLRGLSPGRGGRFGKMWVVGYEVEGATGDAAQGLEHLIDHEIQDLDDSAKQMYAKLLAKAKQNKTNLRAIAGGFEPEEEAN